MTSPTLAQTGALLANTDTAVDFDGSNYVNVPSFTPLDGASAFSLATWVKTDAGTVEKYVLWRSGQLDLRIDTNSIAFSVKTGSTLNVYRPTVTVTAAVWHHVVGVYDDVTDTQKIYLDGVLVGTATLTGTVANGSGALQIAGVSSGGSLSGLVDEVAVHGSALTAAQVSALYDSGKASGPGVVVGTYQYAAFGASSLCAGTDAPGVANTYTYTGEDELSADGLLYLRERYYDPSIGRFTSKDSFPGFMANPQTLNGYTYVGNNPASRTDPSGNCPECYLAGGAAVVGGVAMAPVLGAAALATALVGVTVIAGAVVYDRYQDWESGQEEADELPGFAGTPPPGTSPIVKPRWKLHRR